MSLPPIPDHAPLLGCPFCGRPALVTPQRDITSGRMLYSVGCGQEPDPLPTLPHWEDCLSPTTLWMALEQAVEQWNRRAPGGAP